MPTRKRKTAMKPVEIEEEEIFDEEPATPPATPYATPYAAPYAMPEEEDDPVQALLDVIDMLPGEAHIEVWRKNEQTKRIGFVTKYLPEEFGLDRLQEEHGGGVFQIRARQSNGRYVGSQRTITIESPRTTRTATNPAATEQAEQHPQSSMNSILEVGVMSLIQSMQQAMQIGQGANQMLLESMRNAKGGDNSGEMYRMMMEQMRENAEAQRRLFETLTANKAPDADPLDRALQIVNLMKETSAPKNSMAEMIDLFDTVSSMQSRMGGGGERSDPNDMLLQLGAKALDVMGTAVASQATQSPAPTRPGAPAATPDAPAATPQPMSIAQLLSRYVPQIVKLAQAERDPFAYAQVTLDQIPSMFSSQVTAFVSDPAYPEILFSQFPALAPHREWVTDFAIELRAIHLGLDADEEDDGENLSPLDGSAAPV